MPQRILSALTWKAGIALTVTAIAAGTGATTVHLVSDDQPASRPALSVTDHATTTTTTGPGSATTSTHDDDDDADEAKAAADAATKEAPEHPDNFGKLVSEDAHDGGVDGQEISDMAHERNDARKAGPETAHRSADEQDDDDADDDDQGEDHRSDAADEHRVDDDHGEDTDD